MSYTNDVRKLIKLKFGNAKKERKQHIVLSAKELHDELGYENKFPIVCNAMRQMMTTNEDIYLNETSSKQSSTILIQYSLSDK